MSILVKNMEMPAKCGVCNLFHAESPMYCMAIKKHKTPAAPYGLPRPDWCPLEEQPEIVRCKDCKNSRFFDPCFYCYEFSGEIIVPENGFCFMAERRTDER